MPNYPNISSTLGWNEEPDTTEGLFLQPEEAATIESTLAANATAIQEHVTATAQLNETITANTARISALEAAATTDATTIQAHTERIAELEAENTRLNGKSSGKTGTSLSTPADENADPKGAKTGVRFDDPEHPANKAALAMGIPLLKP